MNAVTTRPDYPNKKLVIAAAVLGLAGQLIALIFMLHFTPYTTITFFVLGMAFVVMAILVFGYVLYVDIKARAESVSEKSFTAGESVFRQGDLGDRIYIVKKGEVEIVREDPEKGETILARLREGEYFGEMALLSDAPRNATARAATKLVCLSIERQDFNALFRSIPAFQKSIDEVVKQRT